MSRCGDISLQSWIDGLPVPTSGVVDSESEAGAFSDCLLTGNVDKAGFEMTVEA